MIYYADFYDLSTILKKHWSGEFSEAFGEWKTMEVWLSELEKLRDPDAHRRELLPHQKYLILGLSGEIRTRLVRYRSKKETSEDYYPRIESVKDNFGNAYTYGDDHVFTGMRLRVGEVIEFVITATDPLGEPLQYAIMSMGLPWQDSNIISLRLTEKDVQKHFQVMLLVRSKRQFHANPDNTPFGRDYDDSVIFNYEVLPPR